MGQRCCWQPVTPLWSFSTVLHVQCHQQVAATNRIDMIDSALLRPGRFDEILHVSLDNVRPTEF